MRACPTCHRKYPPGIKFCPEDGTPLAETDPLLGTRLLDQFELRKICGTGSMGTVYKAWQETMERNVAIKVLRRDLQDDSHIAKRFLREARAAARLSHPNIITVYLVGEMDDGRPFIVMEYVEGESLDDLARNEAPLPPVRALHIARQIASALCEAHDHDIIHRDLKPANILLTHKRTSPDVVKVVDFGIAKILHEGDETQLTQTGAIFGTPYYLSPEQAAGAELDPRCDLYSLGVILFRLLTGRLPFESTSGMEVLIQHLKQQPPRPRDLVSSIPPAVEQLVLRALEKDREERWSSADELSTALESLALELFGGQRSSLAAAPRKRPEPTRRAERPISAALVEAEQALEKRKTETGDPLPPIEASATRPAETPISSLAVHAAVEETLRRRRISEEAPLSTGDTDFLARRMDRGRRVLKHVLLALLSVLVGGAAGATYHFYQRGQTPPTLHADDAPPADDGAAAKSAAAKSAAAKSAAAEPKPIAKPDPVAKPKTDPAAKATKKKATKPKKKATRPKKKATKPKKKATKPKKKATKPKKKATKPKTPAPAPIAPLPKLGKPAKTDHDHDHDHDHGGSKNRGKNDSLYDLVD